MLTPELEGPFERPQDVSSLIGAPDSWTGDSPGLTRRGHRQRLPTRHSSQVLAADPASGRLPLGVGEALGDGAGPAPAPSTPRAAWSPVPGVQAPVRDPGEGGELAPGLGAGRTSETAALERETPLPCKVLFVPHRHYYKCAHPSKTSGSHTLTKEPAALGQEGSGLFRPVGSNSWCGEAVQRTSRMTSLYCELPVVLQKFLSRLTPTGA